MNSKNQGNNVEQIASFITTPSATVDTDRHNRCGLPEVIYCESKRVEEIAEVAEVLLEHHGLAFGTRCSPEKAEELRSRFREIDYHPRSQTFRLGSRMEAGGGPAVLVIAAGTSDLPVADEACRTLETFGVPCSMLADVGVAGIHRLLDQSDRLAAASIIIVIAGMEGALPSVVGGMTDRPVIAVPTSVGYGTAMNGLTALFAMLTSCASGLTVVNIDNGFGAAVAAIRMLTLAGAHSNISDRSIQNEQSTIQADS